MNFHDAELAFVSALHDATVHNIITWKWVPDDNREISRADVDGDIVEIEFVYFPTAAGATSEKVLATVSGMKVCFQVAAGTRLYHIISSMLARKESCESTVKSLGKATARVRRLLEGSP